jgi:hypothetical protein
VGIHSKALAAGLNWSVDCYIMCERSLTNTEITRRAYMKKIMVILMFLGLATTAFAQRGGGHGGGGGRSMGAGGGRAFSGGGGRGYGGGRSYGGSFSAPSYGGGFRRGNGGFRGNFRGGYGYGGYGYRPWGFGFSYYSSPWAYEPAYYQPFCDPGWGPCGYYPPAPYYGYGRPGIAVSVGVGHFAGRGRVGGGWNRFGRR